MLGLTSWCMMVPFKTRFVVSSFEKVLKITGFQRFICLVGPYFFSVLFYTHTYFLAQTALQDHALKTIHIGKMLGQSTLHILVTATIPLARPPIIVGASLELMEVLADYGTVSFFWVQHPQVYLTCGLI